MKVSERTITALARVITGDGRISPYRSGLYLVKFFNELGSNDAYGSGFPSRWSYAEEKVRELNDTPRMANVFELVLDPRNLLKTDFSLEKVVDHLNEYLNYDGYELIKSRNMYRVRGPSDAMVDFEIPSGA